ncbi:uncharacterized protein LAESUDRAFT_162925 [Laetiporus sulphureus 93-53]|uniref:DUF6533 domain-containing protein n=1 Tax=Laetiporus sulphureus 93-53 TaxID=1314785 RepID=A0A165HPH9_9APHY|nr:uncharacterized protein LAESUDRAFT_162925 [Laetiporus sulphureus 93-53]KZT12009.1 hypothetical protein LAESUDRAFT_162925 [Laetiporus sulphureus 93-53]
MAESSQEVLELLQLARDARSTSYATLSGLALLLFDHVLTFQQEVDLFWKGPLSLTKILYLWNRYFSLIALSIDVAIHMSAISSNSNRCEDYLQVQGSLATVITATVDFVLVLRVWILYHRNRTMLYVLVFLFASEVIAMEIISVYSDLPLKEYAHLGSTITGCYSLTVPKYFKVYVVPSLIVSAIMFAMTVYKCGMSLKGYRGATMPLITLFLRDGVLWFLAVVVILVTDILIWSLARATLAELMIGLSCALYSVIASRVLLNIRSVMTVQVVESGIPRTGDTELETMTFQAAPGVDHTVSTDTYVETSLPD